MSLNAVCIYFVLGFPNHTGASLYDFFKLCIPLACDDVSKVLGQMFIQVANILEGKIVPQQSHEVRSFLALEMATRKMLPPVLLFSASTFARLHLASRMLCTGSH
jgi:hypothetical protein